MLIVIGEQLYLQKKLRLSIDSLFFMLNFFTHTKNRKFFLTNGENYSILHMEGKIIMKLSEIKIENFKGLSSFSLSPEKTNVLIGSNGKGKTSVLEAIKFVVTGEGKGFVGPNGTSSRVTSFIGGDLIERTMSTSGSKIKVNGKATTKKSFDEMLENKGIPTDFARFLTSTEALGEMKASELSAFLLNSGLLPVSIPFSKIITLCGFTSEEEAVLASYLDKNALISVDDIQTAYSALYAERSNLKAQITQLKSKIVDMAAPARNGAKIDEEYENIIKLEQKSKDCKSLIKNYNDVINRRNSIAKEIATIDAELKAYESINKPNPAILTKLNDKRDELSASLEVCKKQLAVIENIISTNEKILSTLDSDKCPLCPDKLTCNTDKAPLKAELLTSVEESKKMRDDFLSQISKYTKDYDDIKSKIAAFAEIEKKYSKKLSLVEKRDALMQNIPPAPAKPVVSSLIDYSIKKAELREEKNNWLTYEKNCQYIASLENLTKTYQIYDNLVKQMAPNAGVQEIIVDTALAPLIDQCNDTSALLGLDFELKFECKGGLHIFGKPSGSADFVKYENLSSGEKLIVELLFMDLINGLSGFNILMIDNLDKLDENSFNAFLNLISDKSFQDRYDHIFIATVNHIDFTNALSNYNFNVINM